MIRHFLLASTLIATVSESVAQGTFSDLLTLGSDLEQADSGDFKIDTSMPDYAALGILGSEQAVTNVTTPEDFGASLVQNFDRDGKLQQGFAVAAQPYWFFGGKHRSLENYSSDGNGILRDIYRTQLSFAVVELNDADTIESGTGFKTAFGFSTELLDEADPRFDTATRTCLREANTTYNITVAFDAELEAHFKTVEWTRNRPSFNFLNLQSDPAGSSGRIRAQGLNNLALQNHPALQSEFEQQLKLETKELLKPTALKTALDECAKKATERLQRQRSLRIGGALAGRSDSGDAGDLEEDGVAVWASYRHPFGNEASEGTLSSWGAFFKYETEASEAVEMSEMMDMSDGMMTDDMMAEAEDEMMLATYDGWRAGVNLNRVKDDFVISGALSYVEKDFELDMMEDENYLLATLTASMKIRDGLWAEASFGWADDAQFDAQEFAGIRLKADWGKLGVN